LNKKILKIALLYGGNSSEREISIKTGKAVEKATSGL
jgi:D-alanine-D-alanine ligase-like ATP-grasp enzyme